MDFNNLLNRAKTAAVQGGDKAKQLASEHSETVTSSLSKAEAFVNDKTGGKFSEQLAKGKEGVTSALGVAGQAKEAFEQERAGQESASGPVDVDPVQTDPITPTAPVDKPEQV